MLKINHKKSIIAIIATVVISLIRLESANALAPVEIYNKILINAAERCYNQEVLVGSINTDQYSGFDSLINEGRKSLAFGIPMLDLKGYNETNNKDANGAKLITCKEVFVGNPSKNVKGLIDLNGNKVTVPSEVKKDADYENLKNLLETLGYTKAPENEGNKSGANKKYCYNVASQVTGSTVQQPIEPIGSFCLSEGYYPMKKNITAVEFQQTAASSPYTVSGKIIEREETVGNNDENTVTATRLQITVTGTGIGKCTYYGTDGDRKESKKETCTVSTIVSNQIPSANNSPIEIKDKPNLSGFDVIAAVSWPDNEGNRKFYLNITSEDDSDPAAKRATYVMSDRDAAYRSSISKITNEKNTDKIAFTDEDKYDFYAQYLKANYAADLNSSIVSSICEVNKPNPIVQGENYYIFDVTSGKWCAANLSTSKIKNSDNVVRMTIFEGDERYLLTKTISSAKELVEAMGNLDYDNMKKEELPTIDDSGTIEGGIVDGEQPITDGGDPCYNGDIENSWILCSSLNGMTTAVDGLSKMIGDWLAIGTEFYETGSGTYDIWNIFREIANIGMVLVLLFVIFSQLTGVGIDNYGIKKVLPRLLTMTILINLSFIICQIAIDLSNILGGSLDSMFKAVGERIISNEQRASEIFQMGLGKIVSVVLGALSAAGVGAATLIPGLTIIGTTGATSAVLIVPLILGAIIALISVLMFFVMIGARTIIIILFSAAAPIAFLCYILPNTQKIYKKWFDVLKAALIMYPICGAVHGLSYVIKAIIYSGTSVSLPMSVISIVAPFLPFLALPTLLTSTVSALGVVGQKLSGIGSGIKNGLSRGQSAFQNSELYRDKQRIGTSMHEGYRGMRKLGLYGKDANGKPVTKETATKGLYGKLNRLKGMKNEKGEPLGLGIKNLSKSEQRALAEYERAYEKYSQEAGSVATERYIRSEEENMAMAENKNFEKAIQDKVSEYQSGGVSAFREAKEAVKGMTGGSREKSIALGALLTHANSTKVYGRDRFEIVEAHSDDIMKDDRLLQLAESSDEPIVSRWARMQKDKATGDRVSFNDWIAGKGEKAVDNNFKKAKQSGGSDFTGKFTKATIGYLLKIEEDKAKAGDKPFLTKQEWANIATQLTGEKQSMAMGQMLKGNYGDGKVDMNFEQFANISPSQFGDDKGAQIKGLEGVISNISEESKKRIIEFYNNPTSKAKGSLNSVIAKALDDEIEKQTKITIPR